MRMRQTVRAIFDNIEMLTVEDISESLILKDLIAENLPISIAKAHKAGQNTVSIFEINATEIYVELEKSQWIPALETVISWYSDETVQDYEKCVELSKLIEEVKKEPKKKSLQKKKQSGKTGIQSSKGSGRQDPQCKDGNKEEEQEQG